MIKSRSRSFKLLSLKILTYFPRSYLLYIDLTFNNIQHECWIEDSLHWQHKHRPTVDDLHSKTFLIQDSKLKVDFLDTSGDDEVRVLIYNIYRYSANILNPMWYSSKKVATKEYRHFKKRYFGFPLVKRIFNCCYNNRSCISW